MNKQQRYDNCYMEMAFTCAKLSFAQRSKVGAVLVLNNNIISFGFNGMPVGMDNCCEYKDYGCEHTDDSLVDDSGVFYSLKTRKEVLHAEENLLMKACKEGYSTKGATVYITLSPCFQCSKLLYNAGIKRVVYLNQYKDLTGIDFLRELGVVVEQFGLETVEELNHVGAA